MADLRISLPLMAVTAWLATGEIAAAWLADGPVYGPELQGYDYPYPVHDFQFVSRWQRLDLAYMDVAAEPEQMNGRRQYCCRMARIIAWRHGRPPSRSCIRPVTG